MFCQSCRMNKCVRYSGSFCKTAKSRGFTLIELMIVTLIVVIVTAIAVSSYSAQVQKTRRVEGVSALLELAILMERYYANNGTYLAATAASQGKPGLCINSLLHLRNHPPYLRDPQGRVPPTHKRVPPASSTYP